MSASDSSPEQIRPGLYRAALWSVRLAYACMVFWVVDLVIIRPTFHVDLVWLVGFALGLIGIGLLRLSGAQFAWRGNLLRFSLDLSGETGRHFYRDVFWLPRR